MRPEYRGQIDAKYAKKIEAIVRKAPRGLKEQHEDELIGRLMLPCPVCDTQLAAMDLTCHQCKTTLPICIATVSRKKNRMAKLGRRIVMVYNNYIGLLFVILFDLNILFGYFN